MKPLLLTFIFNALLINILFAQNYKFTKEAIFETEGVSVSKMFYRNTEFRFSDKIILCLRVSQQTNQEVYFKYHIQKQTNSVKDNLNVTVYDVIEDKNGSDAVIIKGVDLKTGRIRVELHMNIEPKESKVPFNFKVRYDQD